MWTAFVTKSHAHLGSLRANNLDDDAKRALTDAKRRHADGLREVNRLRYRYYAASRRRRIQMRLLGVFASAECPLPGLTLGPRF